MLLRAGWVLELSCRIGTSWLGLEFARLWDRRPPRGALSSPRSSLDCLAHTRATPALRGLGFNTAQPRVSPSSHEPRALALLGAKAAFRTRSTHSGLGSRLMRCLMGTPRTSRRCAPTHARRTAQLRVA
jgi:hypothetical protein